MSSIGMAGLLTGLGLTLAAAFAAGAPEGKPEGPVPTQVRHLALGDSYTIGESVGEPERWPVRLVALLRERGVAVGDAEIVARTGWTVRELSHGIDAAAPRGPYALVTLLIGVNDQYRERDPETYRPDFVAMLRRAVGFAGGRA